MKRNILVLLFAIFGIMTGTAQNYDVTILKVRLELYKELCAQISNKIDRINELEPELIEKVEENNKSYSDLIKAISTEIDEMLNKQKNNKKWLPNRISLLVDSLEQAKNSNVPSLPNPSNGQSSQELRSEVELVETNVERDEDVKEVRSDEDRLNDGSRELDDFLAKYSLKELFDDKDNVKTMLAKHKNSPKYDTYNHILRLFGVQYEKYNRKSIKDILQKVTEPKPDEILEKHKSELDEEIIKVNDYRYATKELLRLFGIIDNPPTLKTDDSSSKFEDDNSMDSEQLKKYLEDKNETEYVYRFVYTKQKFEEYLEANNLKRVELKTEISDSLK